MQGVLRTGAKTGAHARDNGESRSNPSSFAGIGEKAGMASGAELFLVTVGTQTQVGGTSGASLEPSLLPISEAGNSLQVPGDVQLGCSLCHQTTAFIVQLVP